MGTSPTPNLIFAVQGAIFAAIVGGWFYMVDVHIMKAESLEMFLASAGTAWLGYFFHVKKGGTS